MRFVLRLLGTWLLGVALILIIIDGTKSLAVDGLVLSSLSDAWSMLHEESLENAGQWSTNNGFGAIWGMLSGTILAWPGFLVTGIPGVIFAFAGRSRNSQVRNIGQV